MLVIQQKKTALATVKNKIPNVNSLVNKRDYDTKITETGNKLNNHNHDIYIDIQEFNTLAADVVAAVSITKNADIDKNKYPRYGIGFDRSSVYFLPDRSFDRNVVIFGVDMNSSVHVDNKGRDILTLGKDPTQGLGEHSLTAEKTYSDNFADHRKKCCLSLH